MFHTAQYRTEVDETVVMAWFAILRDRETKRERSAGELLLLARPIYKRKDGYEYVAQKLSSLSATVGKETSGRDGPLHLRQVRLEGLRLPCSASFKGRTRVAEA